MAFRLVGPWSFFSAVVELTVLNFTLLATGALSPLSLTDLLKAIPAGLRFESTWQQAGEVGHLDLAS